MSFGRRKAITEKYGETLEVNVDEGDAEVCISTTQTGPVNRGTPDQYAISAFTPDQADDVAEQLRAAAAYARTRTPHD